MSARFIAVRGRSARQHDHVVRCHGGVELAARRSVHEARVAFENLQLGAIARDKLVLGHLAQINGQSDPPLDHVCFSALPNAKERTILLGGFSKDYAMTGWRVGYVCANREITAAVSKFHQYAIMSAPTISQYAALAALEIGEPFVNEMVTEYDRRRKLVVSGLNEMGLTCVEPKGAFYAFPSIASTGLSDEQFSEQLILQEKVAVIPGNAFGKGGENHVRIAYCKSYENIEIALERMRNFLRKI